MTTPITAAPRILRLNEVAALIGVSKTTIYEWQKDGRFPMRVKLGPRAAGWREPDVLEWIDSRKAA